MWHAACREWARRTATRLAAKLDATDDWEALATPASLERMGVDLREHLPRPLRGGSVTVRVGVDCWIIEGRRHDGARWYLAVEDHAEPNRARFALHGMPLVGPIVKDPADPRLIWRADEIVGIRPSRGMQPRVTRRGPHHRARGHRRRAVTRGTSGSRDDPDSSDDADGHRAARRAAAEMLERS